MTGINPPERSFTTSQLARQVGYSTQQVRDLERLGVLPIADRGSNGYRRYAAAHVTALHAYRALAAAVGPVAARRLVPELRHGTVAEAAARIDDLHAGLARERDQVREALRGLESAVAESAEQFGDDDSMTIGELAAALGIRSSALRHWEREGLIKPLRSGASTARSYGAKAITHARIIAGMRAGGYGIPLIAGVLEQLRGQAITADVRRILAARLDALTERSVALLAAAGRLHDLLARAERARIERPASP